MSGTRISGTDPSRKRSWCWALALLCAGLLALGGGAAHRALAQQTPPQTPAAAPAQPEAADADLPKPVPLEPVDAQEETPAETESTPPAPSAPQTGKTAEGAAQPEAPGAKEAAPAGGEAMEEKEPAEAKAMPEKPGGELKAAEETMPAEAKTTEGKAATEAEAKAMESKAAAKEGETKALPPGEAETAPGESEEEMAAPMEAAPEPAPAEPPRAEPPRAAQGRGRDAKLDFGTDYQGAHFRMATGFMDSAAHGDRLVRAYVSPAAAAKIYRRNAVKVRREEGAGLMPYPEGTLIVLESFQKTSTGGVGAQGPLFVMQKQARGYDPSGGDWRYGFALPDLQLIGEGTEGSVAFCKACHAKAQARDHVFAHDR